MAILTLPNHVNEKFNTYEDFYIYVELFSMIFDFLHLDYTSKYLADDPRLDTTQFNFYRDGVEQEFTFYVSGTCNKIYSIFGMIGDNDLFDKYVTTDTSVEILVNELLQHLKHQKLSEDGVERFEFTDTISETMCDQFTSSNMKIKNNNRRIISDW